MTRSSSKRGLATASMLVEMIALFGAAIPVFAKLSNGRGGRAGIGAALATCGLGAFGGGDWGSSGGGRGAGIAGASFNLSVTLIIRNCAMTIAVTPQAPLRGHLFMADDHEPSPFEVALVGAA